MLTIRSLLASVTLAFVCSGSALAQSDYTAQMKSNLNVQGSISFNKSLTSVGGTIQAIYVEVPALQGEISLGTAAAPVTKMGPSLRVSRTEQLSPADCNNTYNNNECNAAIVGASYATASDLMQGTGVIGVAVGQQTTVVA